ncbi:hypothetical protein, partial [Klugiella xanthotipulae]
MSVVPIAFSETAANTLITTAETAALVLRQQAIPRSAAVTHAMTNFSGGYAKLFTTAAVTEAEDRARLARIREELAEQVTEVKRVAQKENERLDALAAWEAREAERDKDPYRLPSITRGSPLDADPKPSDYPNAPPTVSAAFSPRDRRRITGAGAGAVGGTSSADPARLRYFVTNSGTHNTAMTNEQVRVKSAWAAFTASCSWVPTEAVTFISGFERLITENTDDATWIGHVADAFEKAGTGSLSDFDVARAVDQNRPGTVEALLVGGNLTPEQVAAAWELLANNPNVDTDALLRKYADVFGSLDGLPAAARVQANQYRAPGLLKAVEAELAAARLGPGLNDRLHWWCHSVVATGRGVADVSATAVNV